MSPTLRAVLVVPVIGGFALLASGSNCSRARVESMNLMNQGVQLAQVGQTVQAVEQLERATTVDPQNDAAFWNLASVHLDMGHREQARDALQRAIAIAPRNAAYHEKLGTVQMQLEDWNGAKQSFEQAIRVNPNLAKAYYKLGRVLERLDDQQGALQRYTEAVQKGPRALESYSALGRLYADLGYREQSVQVLQSALSVAIPGTEEAARAHHLLGTVLLEQRRYDDAVREFRAALDVQPSLHDALFSLGWTYVLQNNREEAKRFLKRFIDTAGDNVPRHYLTAARNKLGELQEGF